MTTTISTSTVISTGLLSAGGGFLIEQIPPSTTPVLVTIATGLGIDVLDSFTVQNASLIINPDISIGALTVFDLSTNGTLQVGSGISANALGSVNFLSGTSGGDLVEEQGTNIDVLGGINGFSYADKIDFANDGAATGYSSVVGIGVTDFTVTLAGGGTQSFDLDGNYSNTSFALAGDGGAGFTFSDDTPCFCAGTRILTPDGEVAVEALRVGDTVVTVRENGPISQKIVWTGSRRLHPARHPEPALVNPVRISAGALADYVPERDLRVSPHHAIYLNGYLMEAISLVNGTTIIQEQLAGPVTYYHIELESHDIVLAEGCAAESFLDTGNKNMFENPDVIELHPDFRAPVAAPFCVPLVLEGEPLAAARAQIEARAKEHARAA